MTYSAWKWRQGSGGGKKSRGGGRRRTRISKIPCEILVPHAKQEAASLPQLPHRWVLDTALFPYYSFFQFTLLGTNVYVWTNSAGWSSDSQRDSIWRRGLREITRFRWGHEGGLPWSHEGPYKKSERPELHCCPRPHPICPTWGHVT